jgi:nucleotide-binding universal stress UspA family protein
MRTASPETRIALRNILMALDFSPASNTALLYALATARAYDARIYLAHVIRPDVYALVSPEALNTVLDQAHRNAEQQMARILESYRLRRIPHQVLLGQGELWSVLSTMIQQYEIELVVMGTHGRTGLQKMLLGSVAEQVFRMASCPVLTVGPRVPGDEVPIEVRLRHIVYATDFTPEAESAAAYALSLAQEYQAQLALLHVLPSAAETAEPATPLVGSVIERLQAQVSPEAELWCRPLYAVEYGEAAEGILKAAAEQKADLIVLGVRHPARRATHLPPATAYKVVCRAHCPVLTVRGPGGVS